MEISFTLSWIFMGNFVIFLTGLAVFFLVLGTVFSNLRMGFLADPIEFLWGFISIVAIITSISNIYHG